MYEELLVARTNRAVRFCDDRIDIRASEEATKNEDIHVHRHISDNFSRRREARYGRRDARTKKLAGLLRGNPSHERESRHPDTQEADVLSTTPLHRLFPGIGLEERTCGLSHCASAHTRLLSGGRLQRDCSLPKSCNTLGSLAPGASTEEYQLDPLRKVAARLFNAIACAA